MRPYPKPLTKAMVRVMARSLRAKAAVVRATLALARRKAKAKVEVPRQTNLK